MVIMSLKGGRSISVIPKTQEILANHAGKNDAVMAILQEVQDEFGYVPEASVVQISKSTGINRSRLYGILTFYAQFRLQPVGKHIIRVCRGTACHVKGSQAISEKLCDCLNIKPGETTEDNQFTVEEVACIGACGMAPVMTIDEDTYGSLTVNNATDPLKKYSKNS